MNNKLLTSVGIISTLLLAACGTEKAEVEKSNMDKQIIVDAKKNQNQPALQPKEDLDSRAGAEKNTLDKTVQPTFKGAQTPIHNGNNGNTAGNKLSDAAPTKPSAQTITNQEKYSNHVWQATDEAGYLNKITFHFISEYKGVLNYTMIDAKGKVQEGSFTNAPFTFDGTKGDFTFPNDVASQYPSPGGEFTFHDNVMDFMIYRNVLTFH
ncbi:hypothetical protein HPT25_20940 [Bacillus sp. BRMEA1]|uniref:hypothetical protein n=1 Tax=Neobacillus endophyticus TaxID=2738405 RepID=UPI0015642C86|nr:hypothetical protein [Neobacillus endophyticus]NRD79805.1 hypothetical protein [Neobacillus endophyticus]